jgi:hypothetical protein
LWDTTITAEAGSLEGACHCYHSFHLLLLSRVVFLIAGFLICWFSLSFHRTIRLPGADAGRGPLRTSGESGVLDTIASIPWFIVGIAGIAMEWVSSRLDTTAWRAQRGYRNVPIDEDAQILRFEDEEHQR